MDDSTSLSSLNSADFILINKEQPQLKVAAGGGIIDLEKNMAEILNESSDTNDLIPDENSSQIIKESQPDLTKSVLFHGVTYLGSASATAPRSEEELHKNMAILNEQSTMAIDVTLCVPDNADGVVRLLDPENEMEIISYRVSQILFCARGPSNDPLSYCWAFTTLRSSTAINQQNSSEKSQYEVLYQCHVFRCENQDAIYRILLSFANAFRRTSVPTINQSSNSRRPTSLIGQAIQATVAQIQQTSLNTQQSFDGAIKFRCYFDIKEENTDNKGNAILNSVPRPEKNVFNLRKNVLKNITVTLQQIRGTTLNIERCFGLLLAQGRNVRASDMQLLDLEAMGKSEDNRYYIVRGYWNPLSRTFKDLTLLNEETPKGASIFLTIGLDLVISGISEPVRFLIEAKARIREINDSSSQDISETIWSSFKKVTPFFEEFDMTIKQVSSKNSHLDETYEVVQLESKSESERRAKFRQLSPGISSNDTGDENNDEAIVSGYGHVSKDCDEEILCNWSEILIKWRKNYFERPKGLQRLVQKGIPEALRCEVWQLLTQCVQNENEMIETYHLLLTKESKSERIIINDLNRTFPAHEYFKEQGGIGQESLYKLSRAYSVRDEEVGYCQGVSFVIATLLIHMPEEQAFILLCKLMEDERYLLREMYKANFENLRMKLYQLKCLIEENLSDIYAHFYDLNIECHMFASQWFLTLFTAKFPLYLVFRIMDIFLYEGFNAIFAVALALLKCNQKDLLSLDFEGVMRFFRVNLPRKYLCEDHADELIQTACSMKINTKKLKRYKEKYMNQRAEEEQKETPLQRLETDNKRLTETCMRSEFENEMLALELVNDRIKLKGNLHEAEDQIDNLTRELEAIKNIVRQSEEFAIRLNEELEHIREAFRDTCDELQRTQKMHHDSKQICSQLNHQLDEHKQKYLEKMEFIQNNCCETCKSLIYSPSSSVDSTLEGETLNDNSNDDDLSSIIPSAITERLHRVEIELAEKKLELTQALCENQELTRQLRRSSSSTINDSETISLTNMRSINSNPTSVSWLSKTVNTIKEAANSTNRTKIMLNYPFDFHFTSAIVCRVASTLKDAALFQREIKEVINIDKARRQHQDYIATLRKLGLDVIELQADESLPEGVFVEDTAVICDGIALICRPNLSGRLKEVNIIRTILKREGLSIVDIKDPLATIDGRDVLFTGREFFVGLSKTTNMGGAKAVASAFPEYPVTLLRIKKGAHLKNFISMVAMDTMAIGESDIAKDLLHQMEENSEYKSYKTITLRDDSSANCLWVNGTLLHLPIDHRYGESIRILINRLGPKISHIELPNSEFAKIDCALTSRCLLFNRPKENSNNDR